MPEKSKAKTFFFVLALLTAALIAAPSIDYIPLLRVGDHGRDLYAFQRTLAGEMPYRDYFWVYGPLMPCVYALCMKIGGVSAASVLAGAFGIKVLNALLVFSCLAVFLEPALAFLGAS